MAMLSVTTCETDTSSSNYPSLSNSSSISISNGGDEQQQQKMVLRCETAKSERQCTEGMYRPSCEWTDDAAGAPAGACHAIDCLASPAKCKKIIFYNRVPKTGSRSMTAAMEVAAERSETHWMEPADMWKQYQWFGYTFKGRYVLNAAYRWTKTVVANRTQVCDVRTLGWHGASDW